MHRYTGCYKDIYKYTYIPVDRHFHWFEELELRRRRVKLQKIGMAVAQTLFGHFIFIIHFILLFETIEIYKKLHECEIMCCI